MLFIYIQYYISIFHTQATSNVMHCGCNGRFGIQIEGGFKTNWTNKRTKKEIKEKRRKQIVVKPKRITSKADHILKKQKKKKEILWSVRSHLAIETRWLASSQWDHTLLFYKNPKKNKEGEENPKTKTRVFKKKPENKRKKTKKKRKEQHRVSIEPTPPKAQRL